MGYMVHRSFQYGTLLKYYDVSALVKLYFNTFSATVEGMNINCKNASHYESSSSLDKHGLDQDVVNNFKSELTGTGSASICM